MKSTKIKANFKGETITLPIYFGIGAFADFADVLGVTMNEALAMQDKLTFSNMLTMIFLSIDHGYSKKGDVNPYSVTDISYMIDDTPGLYVKLNEVITGQMSDVFAQDNSADPN